VLAVRDPHSAVSTASDLADWLLARGRVVVTSAEVADLLQVPSPQVRVRLNHQVHKQRFFSPARGLWVPIPPEFRTWGAIPATHFIDHLMRHLKRDYYVGWLSAAELYGAAHQRPQVFQTAVSAPLPPRDFGRVRLRFVTRSQVRELPRTQRQTPTGQIWVSTPELTALDLVDEPRLGGGLSHVMTVLLELVRGPGLDSRRLIEASQWFPIAATRRLGYLLDRFEAGVDVAGLHSHLAAQTTSTAAPLDPRAPPRGERDALWNVILNATVEPDL